MRPVDPLEAIHLEFKHILDKLGIEKHDRSKLEERLSPQAKMDLIISTLPDKKKQENLKIYISQMKSGYSRINILSLTSSITKGGDVIYKCFVENKGIEILMDILMSLLEDEIYAEKSYDDDFGFSGSKDSHCDNRNYIYDNRKWGCKSNFNRLNLIRQAVSYNGSFNVFEINSREFLLEEYLRLIHTILKKNITSYLDFDIENIVRIVYLHKVYTTSFYNILDHYTIRCSQTLDFLFKDVNGNSHLCVINTLFYDIFKDNRKHRMISYFYDLTSYRNIVKYGLKQMADNRGSMMSEKEIQQEKYQKECDLIELEIEENIDTISKIRLKKQSDTSKITKQDLKDDLKTVKIDQCIPNSYKHNENALQESFRENEVQNSALQANETELKKKELNLTRKDVKEKIDFMIDNFDNCRALEVLPCFIEAFLNSKNNNEEINTTVKLLNEIKTLQARNERLENTLLALETKQAKEQMNKEITQTANNIEAKVDVLEKKLASVKLKAPPFKKLKNIELFVLPTAYFLKKYIPLKWTKMPKKDSLWEEINQNMKIERLTLLFPPKELSIYEKAVKKAVAKERINVVQFFQPKNGNAISIALGRVKVTDEVFKKKVLNLEVSFFMENTIKQLILNFPSNTEIENLKQMGPLKRNERLGRAEEFFLCLKNDYQHFYRKLKVLYYKITFPSQSQSTKSSITRLLNVYKIGLESKALKEFFTVTLFLGNVFNHSTILGNAEGYTISSIQDFVNYTNDNNDKLVDLITEKMTHCMIGDLKVLTGEKIKFDSICTEMAEIDQTQSSIDKEDFELIKNHENEFLLIKTMFEELTKTHGRLCKYFGENDVFKYFEILLNALTYN